MGELPGQLNVVAIVGASVVFGECGVRNLRGFSDVIAGILRPPKSAPDAFDYILTALNPRNMMLLCAVSLFCPASVPLRDLEPFCPSVVLEVPRCLPHCTFALTLEPSC